MNTILVYPCGTRTLIKDINTFGYVTAINIRNNVPIYEISYFSNNGYFSHCFCEFQLNFNFDEEQTKIEIGFRKE
jgi:hypothetical protein